MQPQIKKHYCTCTLCEAMCGIEVTTQDRQILSIAGDKKNLFSEGHVCPKAVALKDLYDDPDRIKQPMQKTALGWQAIDWDVAFDLVANKLHQIQQDHGNDAVAVYQGNPNSHNMGAMLYGPYFYRALKTRNRYSAISVDQLPHHIVSRLLFGHQLQLPIPDIDHTQYFMIIGANPMASNGSLMTVPHIKRRLKAVQSRGGKVVVIDPKRSETAQVSNQHHFIKPGTDALLLLAMLNALFRLKLSKPGRLAELTPQLDEVESWVTDYPPQRVAPIVGISAAQIEQLVIEFCQAQSAVCYGRMGTSVQPFGTLSQYLIMLFNLLTGNIDSRGGMMFTQPAADTLSHAGHGGFGQQRTRVRKLPSFSGEFPVSALAEEMLNEGEGQIKALILSATNPVLTTPNGNQMDKAIGQLDFVVAIDFFINESTRHADIILPPVTSLERDHYDLLFHKFTIRNHAKFSPAIFPQGENSRADWQIYLALAERMDKLKGRDTRQYAGLANMGPTAMVDNLLRSGRYAKTEHNLSIKTLLDKPHGVDLGPLQANLPEGIFHQDKLIHLELDYFMGDLKRLEQHFFSANEVAVNQLILIGRRHLKSNNSWLHNSERLVKGKNRCTAQIHPKDASEYKIEQGQQIKVSSRVGQINIEVEITEDIMPGVISIPHGWGHNKKGTQWRTAEQHAGVSVNELTDEMLLDELSGNAVLNGVPVSIEGL